MPNTTMTWKQGLRFEGVSKYGHPIATDAGKANGGQEDGYSPAELLLFGMIGCSGIDVIGILEKMRQKVTGLKIEVATTQPDEYPRPFTYIEMIYHFTGEGLDSAKLEQAIKLSQEKYCVVAQTVARETRVSYRFDIA